MATGSNNYGPMPKAVESLVDRFATDPDSFRAASYNETQVRREFIDVMLHALGWDVGNLDARPNRLKEVVHEDAVRIGGSIKAPDYAIRVGGERKFFVEAKRPAVNISESASAAYQLRRYGWTAKLPISMLTDFEELAIYDCRVQPKMDDDAKVARLFYCTYHDYEEKWSEICGLLSRDAVVSGALDAFVEKHKTPHGTLGVDSAFLRVIEKWRELLAHDLSKNNPKLSIRDLNATVQLTIDRIIFLRMAEDRGVEPYGALQAQAAGEDVYERLADMFRSADRRYNSGLFHFDPTEGVAETADTLSLTLKISDKPLRSILSVLYYPESPYEFSVLAADTLGHVYEQFLGKTIRLEGRKAVIEEKPAVRKAGGVYYTPDYIVRHIVHRTLGPLLEGRSPIQVSGADKKSVPFRVVDPACGSGSFLVEAYQYLLDWYRDAYLKDDPKRQARGSQPRLYSDRRSQWRLTIAERRRVLLTHIYGVDVDPQAAEVTKLSLLLKVLEGESGDAVASQMDIFKARALPDLSSNIKCGNSLIGHDYFENKPDLLFGEEDQFRINAFSWDEFSFYADGGTFSAVVGNPPWVSLSGKFGNDIHTPDEQNYLTEKFHGNTYMPNMYEYFIARGLTLVRDSGLFSFIVPDRFGKNDQFVSLRERILKEYALEEVLYRAPFPGVTADTLIFRVAKRAPKSTEQTMLGEFAGVERGVAQKALRDPANRFRFEDPEGKAMAAALKRLESERKTQPLGALFQTTSGFGGKSKLVTRVRTSARQIVVLKGESISKYSTNTPFYFDFKPENITGRTTDRAKLGWKPKVLLRKTGANLIAAFDDSGAYPEQSLYFTYGPPGADLFYLLGLLNSRFIGYIYCKSMLTNEASIAQVKKVDLDSLPVVVPSERDERLTHVGSIASAAKAIVADLAELGSAKLEQRRVILSRRIKAAETKIDELVYQLYGLTEAEVAEVTSWQRHLPIRQR